MRGTLHSPPSQVPTPQTGLLTPATLESTLLGYDEAEGARHPGAERIDLR